ncbi:hypothetical protein [Salipaludibacillus daqingensis]|uniref:hypothetical protein n=1 Tax=Salipaludibacillus daqingensis TaxID=3041001 RepID=UPI00247403AA|nr:hypothetical protein [Salipaludibacillus daqingensis]
MTELVRNNEEIFIIIYCFIILWVNYSFIKDFKNIKRGMVEISSESDFDESDFEINPNTVSFMFFALMFNFFRSWLIYILAVLITENLFVAIISVVLFVISLYDVLFNYSLGKVKKSLPRKLFLVLFDTIYITVFVIYLFVF